MIPLMLAVLFASLTGSLHCAGMCGAFVAIAVGVDPSSKPGSKLRAQLAYHAGRLITYVTLGVIAGGIGSALDLAGSYVGVQRVAASVAGAIMILFGIGALLRIRGVKIKAPGPIPGSKKLLERVLARAVRQAVTVRALLIGLSTTLLPCGWLYAFVIVAAGTGHPLWGGLTMIAFWVGTVPILAVVGVGANRLCGSLARFVPTTAAVLIIAAGIITMTNRLSLPAFESTATAQNTDATPAQLLEVAKTTPPACCDDPDHH